jgi:hypothetical protein
MEIGEKRQALELRAYDAHTTNAPTTYFIGQPEEGMVAHGRDDLHLQFDEHSWWGWGLLENWEGNTSQHFRPAGYGNPS